jgi:hypothetical protein
MSHTSAKCSTAMSTVAGLHNFEAGRETVDEVEWRVDTTCIPRDRLNAILFGTPVQCDKASGRILEDTRTRMATQGSSWRRRRRFELRHVSGD